MMLHQQRFSYDPIIFQIYHRHILKHVLPFHGDYGKFGDQEKYLLHSNQLKNIGAYINYSNIRLFEIPLQ